MRTKRVWLVLFCLSFCLPARGEGPAETEVRKLEDRLAKACVFADAAAYEAALSDDFQAVNADGSVEPRKRYVDDIRTGTFRCSHYEFRDVTFHSHGDTVVFHAIRRQTATWNGADCSGDYRLTDVWSATTTAGSA